MGTILSSQRQYNSSSTDQRTQSNNRNTSSNDDIYPAEVVGVVDEGGGGGGEEELFAAASVGHRGSLPSTLNKKSTNITVDKKVPRRTKRYVSVCVQCHDIDIFIAMSFYILRHCQLQNIIGLKYVSQRSFFWLLLV